MYRSIPLIVALSAALASPFTCSAEPTSQASKHLSRDAWRPAQAHFTHVADHQTHANGMKTAPREVVAMAPDEAELNGWRVKLASAEPASTVIQDQVRREDGQEDNDKLNIYGMLAAALGLGVMSIVRRMGRF